MEEKELTTNCGKLPKKNKTNTQQPEVKENISPSQGEGGCTDPIPKGVVTGFVGTGKPTKIPSAEAGRNESQEEKINKKLITDYILFSSDCAENCMRNWKEVQGLYKIKLELKHLL